jgi:hypothetical protein
MRPASPPASCPLTSRSHWRRFKAGLLISAYPSRTPTRPLGNGAHRITCRPRSNITLAVGARATARAPHRGTCRATWRAAAPRLPAVVQQPRPNRCSIPLLVESRILARGAQPTSSNNNSTGWPAGSQRSRSVRRCHGRETSAGGDWARDGMIASKGTGGWYISCEGVVGGQKIEVECRRESSRVVDSIGSCALPTTPSGF